MELINKYSSMLVEKLIGLLLGYPGWIQLIVVLAIAILAFCGVIYLIKKSWKILVTIVSIAVIAFAVYWFFIK